jgi:hypothetical protein
VHCPPGTPHTLVAKLAQRHDAGVQDETSRVEEAYGERRRKPIPYGSWLD